MLFRSKGVVNIGFALGSFEVDRLIIAKLDLFQSLQDCEERAFLFAGFNPSRSAGYHHCSFLMYFPQKSVQLQAGEKMHFTCIVP